MKRLLPLLLLVAALSSWGAIGTPAAANGNSDSGTTATTGTLAAATGDIVYVYAGFTAQGSGCAAITLSVTDSDSHAYTQIGSLNSMPYNCGGQFYYTVVADHADNTVTVTASSAVDNFKIVAAAVSGTAGTIDAFDVGAGAGTASMEITTGLTTTTEDTIVIAAAWTWYNTLHVTADTGNGWATPIGGSNVETAKEIVLEYKIFSSTQTNLMPAFVGPPDWCDGVMGAVAIPIAGGAPAGVRRRVIIAQ